MLKIYTKSFFFNFSAYKLGWSIINIFIEKDIFFFCFITWKNLFISKIFLIINYIINLLLSNLIGIMKKIRNLFYNTRLYIHNQLLKSITNINK